MHSIRSKFYSLFFGIVVLFLTISIFVLSQSWSDYSKKNALIASYCDFKKFTAVIHILQKERGLTVKYIFNPTSSNLDELFAWREHANDFILNLPNVKFYQEILNRRHNLHKSIDLDTIPSKDYFLDYSDIIHEIIASFSSNLLFKPIQNDQLLPSLINLLMTREYLGKIRGYIPTLLSSQHIGEAETFYIKEKFKLYAISKAEFFRSISGITSEHGTMIAESEDIKGVEEMIILFLGDNRQNFDYKNWFEFSTRAMDVYYNIENEISENYEKYLESEVYKSKMNALMTLIVTIFIFAILSYYLSRFINSFSERVEHIDTQMKLILKTNDYKIEISDKNKDEISGISNSLNSLLKFTNQLLEEKEKMASTDKLTGAYNRTKFQKIFDLEFQRFLRYKTVFSVIMMDIDFFKKINDNYGHNIGDSVLVEVTSVTSKIIRATDVLVRWGGEEFVVLAPEIGLNSAAMLADKIRTAISEHSFPSELKVTMSFGVTEIEVGDSLETIMNRADSALYESKHTGRNKVSTANANK